MLQLYCKVTTIVPGPAQVLRVLQHQLIIVM